MAILAGVLILIMVAPTIPQGAPQLEYIIVYGISIILIAGGIAAIVSAFM